MPVQWPVDATASVRSTSVSTCTSVATMTRHASASTSTHCRRYAGITGYNQSVTGCGSQRKHVVVTQQKLI